MSPHDYKPGLRVWYEPSPIGGVRFLGTLTEPPRKLGSSWVAHVEMKTDAYGQWRRFGGEDGSLRRSVAAASLDCLFVDEVSAKPKCTWCGGSGVIRGTEETSGGTFQDYELKCPCVSPETAR